MTRQPAYGRCSTLRQDYPGPAPDYLSQGVAAEVSRPLLSIEQPHCQWTIDDQGVPGSIGCGPHLEH